MAGNEGENTPDGVNEGENADAAAASVTQVAENEELFNSVDVPENLVRFSKTLEDGTQAHLVMSRLAVRDLGGYRDVQRVFENSVHEQRFTFLFTEADIEHAVSDEFKQEGERNIDAKIRYMEENFGDIIRQMTDDYDTTDREELVQSWRELFQHNNFHLVGNNEAFGLISLNLEEFFESFDDLEGSRQQQIDFLLGHELDHGDNYDAKSDGPKGLFSEVLSDRTGVSSIAEKHHPLVFWSSRVSQEDFERSVTTLKRPVKY